MKFKTADLLDNAETGVQVVLPGLKNYGGFPRFHGPIQTVRADHDNSRAREQLWSPGEGRVLVIDNASKELPRLGFSYQNMIPRIKE